MEDVITFRDGYSNNEIKPLTNRVKETFKIGDWVAASPITRGDLFIGAITKESAKSIYIEEKKGRKIRLEKSSVFNNLRRL